MIAALRFAYPCRQEVVSGHTRCCRLGGRLIVIDRRPLVIDLSTRADGPARRNGGGPVSRNGDNRTASCGEVLPSFDTLRTALSGVESPKPGGLSTVGERLGPYEITGRLGAGGMGEVYRAR